MRVVKYTQLVIPPQPPSDVRSFRTPTFASPKASNRNPVGMLAVKRRIRCKRAETQGWLRPGQSKRWVFQAVACLFALGFK